jgi:uncharacterized protein
MVVSRSMNGAFVSCVAGLSLVVAACKPAIDPEVVVHAPHPMAETGAAKGEGVQQCRSNGSAAPLIVDWLSTQRFDLDVAMKQGVAVVAYDCKATKLLKECKLPGAYSFAGVTPKEEALQLSMLEELQANVPFNGAGLISEVQRGSAIDLGLVVVGKRATTVAVAARPDLVGSCAGATHFVRSALLGAFSLAGAPRGSARPVADLFGPPPSGQRTVASREGALEACRSAKPEAAAPPEQCQTAIRLELVPLLAQWPAPGEPAAKPPEDDDKLKSPCPPGMGLSGSKCSSPAQATAHLCKPDDERECGEQCDKGDPGSCYHLGAQYLSGKDLARDDAKAAALFDKACGGGVARACYARAEQYARERTSGKDAAAKAAAGKKAQELSDRACDVGDGWACQAAAGWYLQEGASAIFPKEPARAAALLRRGCGLGHGPSCSTLAGLLLEGKQMAKDVPDAVALLQRACEGGRVEDCEALGDIERKGQGVPKDVQKAIESHTRACNMGFLRACNEVGVIYAEGDGVPRDLAKAYALFGRGCPDKGFAREACVSLAAMYDKATGIPRDMARATELYERGCAGGGCTRAAEIWQKGEGVTADPDRSLSLYEKACTAWSDKKACDALGPLLEKKDKERAKTFYADVCTRTRDKAACASLKRLGGTPPPAAK